MEFVFCVSNIFGVRMNGEFEFDEIVDRGWEFINVFGKWLNFCVLV